MQASFERIVSTRMTALIVLLFIMQVHPGASRLEHPRFQPTFLSDLAHSSSMEFQQSLISQQQQSSLHYPTHHPMGESLHPPPVGLGGVNPHRHVQLNEAQTFSVPMEPPRYSVMFPCEGGWKLERQVCMVTKYIGCQV